MEGNSSLERHLGWGIVSFNIKVVTENNGVTCRMLKNDDVENGEVAYRKPHIVLWIW